MAPYMVIEKSLGEPFALHLAARAAHFHVDNPIPRQSHELMSVPADDVAHAILLSEFMQRKFSAA